MPSFCAFHPIWVWGGGGGGAGLPRGLGHYLLLQFSNLGSSKMVIFETDFFDILTIQNDQISYAKHVLAPLHMFFRCCVVRLPEAALFLLSPTSAVPCARTVRTATSCSRSPRRALRLLAAAERRVAGPAPSGPGRQTAFAHPTACPCGSSLGLRQPRAPGRPISGCRWAHPHPLRRPLHGGDLNLRCALRVCRHPLCER